MRLKVIVCVMITLMFIAGCVEEPTPKPPTRESRIPDDAVKQTPETDNYPPKLHSDGWEEPVPMSSVINTAGAEDSPFITPDGQTFYFVFVADVREPPEKQLAGGAAGIYYTQRVGNDWGEVKRLLLGKGPSDALDGCQFVQDDVIWFCSVRAGNYREVDLYTAKLVNGRAKDVKNAGKRLNKEIGVGEMHITADGNEMYFHADLPGGKGGKDIYVTKKVDGIWQDPEPVDAVNGPDQDGYPFISRNGQELWFTRTYLGTPGTFRSKKNGTGWDEPELILSRFAGEPTLDNKGNIYFVHHYYDNGTMLEADIYVAYKK